MGAIKPSGTLHSELRHARSSIQQPQQLTLAPTHRVVLVVNPTLQA